MVSVRLAAESVSAPGPLPVVGKDVLELLSTAMYVEPLTIYREYVQNAADAVDDARRSGRDAGRVDIRIDPVARSIVVRDDGTGIPSDRFAAALGAVGASAKRDTTARGFRGVGRLSGLAYARSLTFRSRAAGEDHISTMTWDCRALRLALRDRTDERDLPTIISAITTTATVKEDGPPFFEVRLDGVARQGDDRLMSASAVSDYLSQVAPVPFSPGFSHRQRIAETLRPVAGLGCLDIVVNDAEQLTRPFHDTIPVQGGRPLNLREITFVDIPSYDGGIGAIGWVAHHDYEGAIHPSSKVRGLRIRVGDIQVGEAGVLADIFPEHRFDAWTIGEIHVLDPCIVPNGRRDDFERNVHLANLKNHLAPIGRDVANRCRTSSRERKRLRDIELEQAAALEGISVLAQGSLGSLERDRVALDVELSLMRTEKLIGPPDLLDEGRQQARASVADLRFRLEHLAGDAVVPVSPLDRLPPERRVFFEEMFALIYENSQNRATAKSLVDRIIAKLGSRR